MNTWRMAELWVGLMTELGYERFAAQGGDFGASVSTILGLRHADRVIGIHLNYVPRSYRPYLEPGTKLEDIEQRYLDDADQWYVDYGAYAHLQRNTPQTAAYGLNDSPAALAAWIVEKFRDWSDCDGDVERRFSKDELLSNVTLYWMTETIHSSCRLYYESKKAPLHFKQGERGSRSVLASHISPRKRRSLREPGSSVDTTFSTGPKCRAARTLPPPKNLNCWLGDIASFFRSLRTSCLKRDRKSSQVATRREGIGGNLF